jgi:hypothetical protein
MEAKQLVEEVAEHCSNIKSEVTVTYLGIARDQVKYAKPDPVR